MKEVSRIIQTNIFQIEINVTTEDENDIQED